MVSLTQYAGFGDTGKQLKDTAFASAVATLVLPLSTLATVIIMSFVASRGYYYFGMDYEAASAFTEGCFIAVFCIIGGLILLFYLALLNYKIRTFKSLKNLGEQSGNADISALAKHWFIELILMVAVAPLFAVTGIVIVVNNFVSYSSYAPWRPVLLLANWFAMALTGMYSVVDGFKKWQPVGQLLTSYKGRAGMQFLTTSQGVGLAILIISHYAMVYLLSATASYGTCGFGSYSGFCSMLSTMFGFLFPAGVASGILTLIATVNHIKGLFRVGNAFIDLEEGRVSASPYARTPSSGTYPRQQQSYPYGTESPYNARDSYSAPAAGSGYQSGTWNAPHYTQSLQPMQPVSPAPQNQPASRDTSAIEAEWEIEKGAGASSATAQGTARCKNCQAALPPNEEVIFCPYCGSSVK
jgi:hypothetical protein